MLTQYESISKCFASRYEMPSAVASSPARAAAITGSTLCVTSSRFW